MSLTLKAYEPLSEQGLYAREFIDDITANHEGYTHTISAVGGFDTAQFTLKGDRDYLDDWFQDGLMRRIEAQNPEGIQIWEGYVSRMRYTVGTLVKTKTVDNMFNRVYVRFAPLDFSVFPPIASPPQTWTFDDADSQARYGIKSLVVPGGERVPSTVYDWGRTILKNRKDVQIGEAINTSGQDSLLIDFECRGYWHALKWIPYINEVAGSVQGHQAIEEALRYFNSQNQGWLPMNFPWMDYQYRSVRRGSDSLQSCYEYINNIILEGGAGGERWVGGFYQDRKFVYKQAEDILGLYGVHLDLFRTLSDRAQFVYDSATGVEVKPWDMVPDRILGTVDDIGDNMYIEQMTFREPYGLQLVGGDDERLAVFLKQRGLPGV